MQNVKIWELEKSNFANTEDEAFGEDIDIHGEIFRYNVIGYKIAGRSIKCRYHV